MHGCARELAEILERTAPDRVVSVGDLFTKGPDPAGVLRLVEAHGIEAVLGNHEVKLLDVALGRRKRGSTVTSTAAALDEADPAWVAWIRSLPLTREVRPWTVVHAGLHPSGRLRRTSEAMATTLRRWPPDDPKGSWWHEVYRGKRRVIFGHDAMRGLVDRRPRLLGLDTGCVYGGRLTGYLVEADRLVSVQAREDYHRAR